MPCPFISQLSTSFVKNSFYSSIIRAYMPNCPVMSQLTTNYARQYSHVSNGSGVGNENSEFLKSNDPKECPFLESVKPTLKFARPEIVQDIFEHKSQQNIHGFEYAKFFADQILQKKKDHSYRIFKKVSRFADKVPHANEFTNGCKPITVWCSNDYLGMTSHPKVKNAIIDAVEKFGSGSGGTRNISGNTPFHEELEKEIAILHNKESALLFTSCFVANDSTLFTLAKALPNCHIFSDAGNHASMIQGIRNSGAKKFVFKTCDVQHLESQLKSVDYSVPKIVAFETVHSMTGAISPISEMCDVAHRYGAITFVDEVHAVGLYGTHGAGVGERDNVMHKMDIVSGTLGKAFGNIGGYIASSGSLVDMIRSYAAGFIFTTSLPPTVLKGAITSIKILKSDEGRRLREKHQKNVAYMKEAIANVNLPMLPTQSHIIPIHVGDPWIGAWICNEMLSRYGHYVQAINYPTVAKGQERLRIAPTPFHTPEMIDEFVENLVNVWKDTGLNQNMDKCTIKNCHNCNQPFNLGIDQLPCGSKSDCPQLSVRQQ